MRSPHPLVSCGCPSPFSVPLRRTSGRCLCSGHSCPCVSRRGGLCLLLKWGQTNPQSSGESQGGSQQTAAPYLGKSKLPEMFLGFGRRLQGPALTGGSARVCRCSRAPELVSSLELGEIPKRPSPPVFQAKVSERPLPARLPQAHARERRSDRQKQHEALSLN